ncbi:hypothetical protein GCM10010343_13580 [Streptomyces avidinii]|nr:hypothetical protein GCM10010343_13580 [Streptomyces avidinii]
MDTAFDIDLPVWAQGSRAAAPLPLRGPRAAHEAHRAQRTGEPRAVLKV